MELLLIIFLLWLIGCAFPGSGRSYGPSIGGVFAFIACSVVFVALAMALVYAAAGIAWLLGDVMLIGPVLIGLIASPMIFAGGVGVYNDCRAARAAASP